MEKATSPGNRSKSGEIYLRSGYAKSNTFHILNLSIFIHRPSDAWLVGKNVPGAVNVKIASRDMRVFRKSRGSFVHGTRTIKTYYNHIIILQPYNSLVAMLHDAFLFIQSWLFPRNSLITLHRQPCFRAVYGEVLYQPSPEGPIISREIPAAGGSKPLGICKSLWIWDIYHTLPYQMVGQMNTGWTIVGFKISKIL